MVAGLAASLLLVLGVGVVVSSLFAVKSRQEARLARQREYDANMLLTQNAWEQNQVSRLLDLLKSQEPGAEQEDLRGFEWHYWKNKVQRGHITLKGHTRAVTSVSFSPDGKRLASGSFDQTVKVWDASRVNEMDPGDREP